MSGLSRLPRIRAQTFQRYALCGDEQLVSEIAAHTDHGGVAIVRRWGGPHFTIVLNGSLYLLRPNPLDGIRGPVGSYSSVILALAASDAWANRNPPDDDFGSAV